MAHSRIRPRRSTAPEFEYQNPILAEGEMAVEYPETGIGSGLVNIKFGDGVTPWKDLPYGVVGKKEETEVENELKLNPNIKIATSTLRIS